ncbi:MAG: DNA-binding protein [Clostridiales bacterium]|nr:DNA-binding protein [Clostridiales bacterium]
MKAALAFDTSNYTTSCAVFDGSVGRNAGRLLHVERGKLGLRQSEALFAHVRQLPEVFSALGYDGEVLAVGASTKPRETEDSYMPCFLAGASQGRVLAQALGVPFFAFSHQQGHIAAAAWSAGRVELLDKPHLAWQISGGTTELLLVRPHGTAVKCEIIGATTDVSAGQLIDRTGQLLGLSFPAGKELDALSQQSESTAHYEPKLDGLYFSLSGVEHKVKQLYESGAPPADVAAFALRSLVSVLSRVTERAKKRHGDMPVLFSGGVASNSMIRRALAGALFAEPRYSTDNALGVAILTYRAVTLGG